MEKLSASEQLCYTTVRIECQLKSGETSTGTGFFFKFLENKENNTHIPVVITNKHVIENAEQGRLIISKADKNGNPLDKDHFSVFLPNFESLWRLHPDPAIDLCAMPITPFITEANKSGTSLFYLNFEKSLIPNEEQKKEFSALEDILMIGYPNGIWDEVNNKPILRKGTTATHPNNDYNGKKEIMIDVPCFPGSSGSPVLIFNEGSYKKRDGGLIVGNRVLLIGVLYAGPQHTATGEIKIINIPVINKAVVVSRIPNNLGLIIKSESILELEELFK